MAKTTLDKVIIVVGRILGWGLLGGICGVVLGLVVGLLNIPPDNPNEPLVNEWYALGVIFVMFFECCAGFLLGAGIAAAVRGPSARRNALLLAIAGAVLGVGGVKLVPDPGDDALVLSMFTQTIGVVVTLSVGGLWWARMRRLALRGGHDSQVR